MKVLIADQNQVTKLLPMADCIEVMADALRSAATGRVDMPLRSRIVLPDGDSILGWMPGYAAGLNAMGIKVISAFPKNHGTAYDSHIGVVLLFETENGLLRAIVDATAVTAIRTAAVSGVATRVLAREDAGDLAIIGAGTQAKAHLEAMLRVREIRRARVASRNPESARAFAERESARHGIAVEAVPDAKSAVDGADIVCTVTSSNAPVVLGEWLAPGTHINAVGAFKPNARELDTAAVVRSKLYADRMESILAEPGDFLIPKAEGAVGDDHVAGEIGEVLAGLKPGRESAEEITLFKSLGIAVEDLAAADFILRKAEETGAGTFLEIGGRHFGSG